MKSRPPANWSFELERLALQALLEEYRQLNYGLFSDKLEAPALRLSESSAELGLWEAEPPTIHLSRLLVLEQPWGSVVEVLKHEMAHQFVSEVLGVAEPRAHGPVFQKVCQERGIDGAASGLRAPTQAADSSVLGKIRHLLALAESSEQHEAEAAAAAAQRLMLKHNLREVSQAQPQQYCFIQLGEATGRVAESQRTLASILRDFFFVEVIWVGVYRPLEGKHGSVIEVCGTRANVELAQYVHSFLNHSAQRLWREHKRRAGIRGDRDRRAFEAGVMAGFHKKLKSERQRSHEQGLVWQGDAELNSYFRKRFPRIRNVQYGTSSGTGAHAAGRAAGQGLVLHRGVTSGPSAGPRLLGRG
jgi:hypothetical protein